MLPKIAKAKKPIYLDHAATTPLDLRVKKVMDPFWSQYYGNPSGLYKQGREAHNAVEHARGVIAEILNSKPSEIIFTAGGTESINLAIFGIVRNYTNTPDKKYHLITSSIEHHAVLHAFNALKHEGYDTTLVDVDSDGVIKLDELKKAVRPETILISVMYANNEIGTIEPIAEIGKWIKSENEKRKANNVPSIIFHVDACQAAGSLDMNVQKLGVDLLSANGSKMYGPKQTGFLYVRSGVRIKPLIYGGGQEKNLRSGTENVPGIVGLAESFQLAQKEKAKENKRLQRLRDYFIDQIFKKIPKVVLNGPDECIPHLTSPYKGEGQNRKVPLLGKEGLPVLHSFSEGGGEVKLSRLPNNINVSILDIEGEALLLYLDAYGIAMSTGSACTSTSLDPSHVILAIGRPYEYAHGSMRFTLGKFTTKKDINYVMKVLPGVVEELRRISPVKLDPAKPQEVTMEKAFVGENMRKFRNKKVHR